MRVSSLVSLNTYIYVWMCVNVYCTLNVYNFSLKKKVRNKFFWKFFDLGGAQIYFLHKDKMLLIVLYVTFSFVAFSPPYRYTMVLCYLEQCFLLSKVILVVLLKQAHALYIQIAVKIKRL